MSSIFPHHYGSTTVRVIVQDGAPWFVLDDIRAALGGGPWVHVADELDDDEKTVAEITTAQGRFRVVAVNLSGLYAALALHRDVAAKPFKRWITAEVLPSIPNHGSATLLPPVVRNGLSSTSDIASCVGMSPGKLGRRVKHLKTPQHGELRAAVGLVSEKPVEQWWWNAAGRDAVLREFYRFYNHAAASN